MFNNPISDINTTHNELGNGMQDVERTKFLDVGEVKNPYIIRPDEYQTQTDLFNAMHDHWLRIRNMESTILKQLAMAKRMANHHIFPVNWFELNPNQIIAYLEHREYTEYAGPHAIRNEWKTVKTFAQAYGIDTELWGYRPPSPPKPKVRIIPLPEQVKKITSYKYCKDKYNNSLIHYVLYHGFLLGFRPSEIAIQKLSDLYLDQGYLIITETKKHYQLRQVFPERELLTNDHRKSLKNWLKWRSRIQTDNDFLYIQKNGKPFTVDYLRKWICSHVKPIFPDYTMYTMRHWCAIARLIKSKIDTEKWDTWEVKEWLGHDEQRTTEEYIRYAKRYYRIAPYDWIKALLKFHEGQYKGSKIENYIKQPLFRVETTGVEEYGPTGLFTHLLLLKSLKKTNFLAFPTSLNNPFSFFVGVGA